MFIDNHSRAGTGVVPVIPNYTETQAGIYGIGKYNYSKGGVEAGVRFDGQETRASGYDWTGNPMGEQESSITYHTVWEPITFFSGHWKLTTNFGMAWRAPHVYELYSNGNELGSGMFVRGDSVMNSERSYKWISSISYSGKVFSVHADGYLQWISGYIYDEPQKENITVISGAYPIFQYRQTPAFFRGMDFDFHFMPADSWDYHLTASFIRANERTTGNYLPYIPLSVSTMSFHGTTEPGRISGCVWVSGTVSWQNRPGLTRIRILSRTLLRHTIFLEPMWIWNVP